MRCIVLLCSLVVAGCGANSDPPPRAKFRPLPTKPLKVAQTEPGPNTPADPDTYVRTDKPIPSDDVPDLRTRSSGSDWPSFLGPTADSVSSEKAIIAPWPKEGLRIVWTKETGSGYVIPAVSKGRLFLADGTEGNIRLRCLKSETGESIWQFDYPTAYQDSLGYDRGPRSVPVVDGGRVYICGPEGMLHCLSVTDGALLWKVDTVRRFGVVQNFFGVGSTPVIEGELLLVQVGGSPPGSPEILRGGPLRGNGTALVAFDKLTGEVKFSVGDELASYAGPVLATINGQRWCFLFARGGLVGFNLTTRKVEFHYPWRARILESVNASNPVVVGDQVFISECYGVGSSLLRVKPGGYDVVWSDEDRGRQKSMMCHWMTPIHHRGYLYGSSGRHESNAELRCIELATGKVAWSEPGLERCSLLLIDGHFICQAERGPVYLLKVNPQKFEVVSQLDLNSGDGGKPALLKYPCWAAPIVAHGLLYLRGQDQLVCLELIPK